MDKFDRSILSILQENARISNVDLADRIGLSASACLRRVAQLEKDGLVTGYHANLSLEKLGYSVLVLVHITLQGQSKEMLQDFETKKKTEIDFINGAIPPLAAQSKIPTPFNDHVCRIIHDAERQIKP